MTKIVWPEKDEISCRECGKSQVEDALEPQCNDCGAKITESPYATYFRVPKIGIKNSVFVDKATLSIARESYQKYLKSRLLEQVQKNTPEPNSFGFGCLLLRTILGRDEFEAAVGDLLEAYEKDVIDFGQRKASFYYLIGALSHVPAKIRLQIMIILGALWGYVTGMFS